MRAPAGRPVILVWAALSVFAARAYPQIGETLSGPDSHETGQGPHGHLLGDWGGVRPYLFERGVRFDLQYISDSLSNIESARNERFVSWNRVRGTVDIDFGALLGQSGLYFHATALWQAGGNLFRPNSVTTWNTEHGLEFNILLDVAPMILLQPLVQYYANVGGGSESAVVVGFRTKVEF